MRFFLLLILILLLNPFLSAGSAVQMNPEDSLLTDHEIAWLKEHSENIRYAPNPSWGVGDFVDENGLHKGIIADYIRIFEDKPDVSFRKLYYNSGVGIDSTPEKGFFERNIKLFLLLAGLFLLVSLLILTNISVLKNQVRKKTAELQKKLWHEQLTRAKEKAEISEKKISLLNEMVLEILKKQKLEDIYNYISSSLQEQFPGTIILCISINEAKNLSKLESVSGLDSQLLDRIMKISGFNPVGKNYNLTSLHYNYFKSGKLVEFEGGLADFSATEFPKAAARTINKLTGINKIYTIGINKDDSLFAAIHFFSRSKNDNILDDAAFIETFVNQAGLVLQKIMIREELIEARDRAEESDRLKSNFLQNISHEIRTPLNAIVGFSQLMTDPELTEEEHKIYADQIQNGSDKLTGVIKDIIEISQVQSGQTEISKTEFDLVGLITELTGTTTEKAKNKKLELRVHQKIAQEKFNIETDREKLRAILIHLMDNAVKFTPEGSVKIITDIRDEKLYFSISDTGIGIAPETQKVIFEPFRQSDTDSRRKYGGNGLGLSLVRAYTELLGGSVNLESKVNKGTTVTVSLPVVKKVSDKTEEVPEKSVRPVSKVNNKKDTVIIAEDEYANFLYLKKLIKEDNFNVLHARDGYEVIDLCRSDAAVNLIFMDIKMPKMDGHTAAKMIKEFRPDLPIIAQTAYALESDKLKFADVFDDYITKPIEKLRVRQIIKKYSSSIN
ncbi:MAG: ATP-binding protein [Bacteroidales bacterium]